LDNEEEAVALNKANGRIAYRFHAAISSGHGPGSFRNIRAISGADRRAAAGRGSRKRCRRARQRQGYQQRLYQLVRQPKPIADRQFEIEFLDPNVEAFAFTFG